MKRFMNVALLGGLAVTLGACAQQCPEVETDYSKPPYVLEGTAGEGVAVYDSGCPVAQERVETQTRVEEHRYEPTRAAEPVFRESQTK